MEKQAHLHINLDPNFSKSLFLVFFEKTSAPTHKFPMLCNLKIKNYPFFHQTSALAHKSSELAHKTSAPTHKFNSRKCLDILSSFFIALTNALARKTSAPTHKDNSFFYSFFKKFANAFNAFIYKNLFYNFRTKQQHHHVKQAHLRINQDSNTALAHKSSELAHKTSAPTHKNKRTSKEEELLFFQLLSFIIHKKLWVSKYVSFLDKKITTTTTSNILKNLTSKLLLLEAL